MDCNVYHFGLALLFAMLLWTTVGFGCGWAACAWCLYKEDDDG